jgi:hypothetical protein
MPAIIPTSLLQILLLPATLTRILTTLFIGSSDLQYFPGYSTLHVLAANFTVEAVFLFTGYTSPLPRALCDQKTQTE